MKPWQAPQFAGSVWEFSESEAPVARVVQLVSAAAQVAGLAALSQSAVPPWQNVPPPPPLTQPPQLCASAEVSVEQAKPPPPLQVAKPGRQSQVPALQYCVGPQALPLPPPPAQPPQLFGSLAVSTQAGLPPQFWKFPVHTQLPPTQLAPMPPQAWPQPPQLFGSVFTSTQEVPQTVPGEGQVMQLPPAHCWFAPHAVAQLPQWAGFVARSAQAPLQSMVLAGHAVAHWPPLHTWLPVHAVPQAPQLFGLVWRSTQAPAGEGQ